MDENKTMQKEFDTQLQCAKTDKRALNTLLHDYMPFIKKCVADLFYKSQSKADNLTDAMLAFAHSVQTYDPDQGSFIQFAATVIRNRLIDNIRKELLVQKRFFSFSVKQDQKNTLWENSIALQSYNQTEEERNLRLEIDEINDEFAKWGFTWTTLLKKCPKQERSRHLALRIARTVLENADLLEDTLKTRQLPINRLADFFSRKALEKYRQYIVALIIISQGDYPYVYSFLPHHFIKEKYT